MKRTFLFSIILLFSLSIFAQNLNLVFQWKDTNIVGSTSFNNAYNEIWGTVQNGVEYAIIGSTFGLHIFDVSNPNQIYMATEIPTSAQGPVVVNRDFHEFQNYLYIVADQGPATLQIADLSYLPDSAPIIYDSNVLFSRGHTIFVDEPNEILYVCGGNNLLNLYSLADPANPTLLINCATDVPGWNNIGYIHDIFVRDNVAYCNAGNNGLFVVDFSDLSDVKVLGSLTNYLEKGYNHSGRLHENNEVYVFTDETHNTGVKVCDVTDISDIKLDTILRSETHPENTIAHDVSIRGDILYVSYYYDGIYVYDITNSESPILITTFATTQIPHRRSFEGCWGVYGLLPSGLLLASDMQEGLFVFTTIGIVSDEVVENKIEENVKIFPNPSQNTINIQHLKDNSNLQIFDLSGKLVLQKNGLSNAIQIDISHLEKGIYFVEINNLMERFTQKIIKY